VLSTLENQNHTLHPFLRSLCAGALVGGAFGVVDTLGTGGYAALPLTSEILIMAVNWYVAALAGLVAALAFRLARFLPGSSRRQEIDASIQPVSFSLSVCVWILLIQDSYLRAVLAVAAAAIVFFVFARLARSQPWLHGTSFWGFLNSVGLFGFACWIMIRGPLAHGIRPVGAWVFLPAAVLALLGFLIPRSRRFRRWGLAGSALVLVLLGVNGFVRPLQRGHPTAEGPNILLITVDTLRDDHLGCYGNEMIQTPNVDRLAEEGVLFENTICPIPLTNPSHTSILTGLHPAHHGVLLNEPMALRPGIESLADILADRGYRTAAFVSGITLKRQTSCLVDRFQVYDDDFSPLWAIPEPCLAGSFANLFFRLSRHVRFLPHGYTPRTERPAAHAVDAANRWLAANAEAPFFLWLHLFDPHGPYTPPPPYNRLYDPDYAGDADGRWYGLSIEEKARVIESPRDLEHVKALYAGEVSYADEQMGRLLSEVERLGLRERTLVVFTADHGESLTEHDYYFDHSVCLYDPSLKVPLIFRFPGGSYAGERRLGVAQLIDIAPTVLDYLGIERARPTDGESLKARCLDAPEDPLRGPVVSAIFRGEIAGGKRLLCIRTAGHKYIRTSRWFGDQLLMPASEEIYDLEDDPGETRNLIHSGVEGVEEYRSLAEEYWNAWNRLEVEASGPIPRGVRESLRSLGYLQ